MHNLYFITIIKNAYVTENGHLLFKQKNQREKHPFFKEMFSKYF